MFSFPKVGYFNYAFKGEDAPISREDVSRIKDFYKKRGIGLHRIILPSVCKESLETVENEKEYHRKGQLIITAYPAQNNILARAN